MNYTREPIIETVISPKEGCKLVVRNSKGGGQEEYFVEALEVVNFGNSIFFRSTERPKSFLVPATDYEVIELKETKMVLKSTSIEQSIKIGGGKTTDKSQRRKKPMRKHHKPEQSKPAPLETKKGGGQDDETQVSSSILRKLFPPPPNLINEKLNHFKSTEKINESISKEIVKEEPKEKVVEEKVSKEKKEIEKPKEEKPPIEEKKEE